MRAVALTDFGTNPVVTDLPIPEPAEGEVRVQVRAASVNGFDLAVANGYVKDMMEHRFPVVLGKDSAGTIDAVGPGTGGFQVGDRVFGVVTKSYLGDGSFADYVTVPATIGIAKLPGSINFNEGATLDLASGAALAAVDAADLQPGQIVLVAGATGGVGTQAVQLAAAAGATVIATARTDEERQLVAELGADERVDHSGDVVASILEQHPDGVDLVLHFAGDTAALLGAVRMAGRLVSSLIGSSEQLPSEDATIISIYANPDASTLDRSATNHAEGRTRRTSSGPTGWRRLRRRWPTSPVAPSANSSSPRTDLTGIDPNRSVPPSDLPALALFVLPHLRPVRPSPITNGSEISFSCDAFPCPSQAARMLRNSVGHGRAGSPLTSGFVVVDGYRGR